MKYKKLLIEFWKFGLKMARSSIFAASFFIVLALSQYIPLFGLPRYDFLLIAAIIIQIVLIATKLESKKELKVIFIFHLIGLVLEIFKTSPSIQSWAYPEEAYTKIFEVPLYAGFMYSAVASFISQSWNQLDIKLSNYPSVKYNAFLALVIYLNFFTHHFIPDLRWYISLMIIIAFKKTTVNFKIDEKIRKMPLIVSFLLIGFFIWIAENISTFFGAWVYPNQELGWHIVSLSKISSWSLLVIVSFIIVANLKIKYKSQSSRLTDG